MDTPIKSFPRGDLRVSDADRDRAVAELSEHFQTGRLAQEEFEDRAGRALQARTGGELSELFTDLPRGQARADMPPAAVNPGGVRRAGRVPVAPVVIACVIAVIIVGNVLGSVFGNSGHVHGSGFGWLIPVLILGFVFRRMVRSGR
jgi:Domain of unknown function (DUF1707)